MALFSLLPPSSFSLASFLSLAYDRTSGDEEEGSSFSKDKILFL